MYEEIYKSKVILSDIINDNIKGFRCPNFAMPNNLFEILSKLNFKYDSSLCKSNLHLLSKKNYENFTDIKEIPIISNLFPSGGGFMRFLPKIIFNNYVLNKKNCILYIHPWDMDNYRDFKKDVPIFKYFMQTYNSQTISKKLEDILKITKSKNLISLLNDKE